MTQLSEQAIGHNSEIASIDERLELVAKQIDRQYERRWLSIFPALADLLTLNPFSLIESLFGGGSFREVDLRLADLQLRVSDLIRRRAELTVQTYNEVLGLVLEVEKGDRQISLLNAQLVSHQQRVAVLEISYRLGQGSTTDMISLWQQTENLQARLTEVSVQREHSIRALLQITGYEIPNHQLSPIGDRRDDRSVPGGEVSTP